MDRHRRSLKDTAFVRHIPPPAGRRGAQQRQGTELSLKADMEVAGGFSTALVKDAGPTGRYQNLRGVQRRSKTSVKVAEVTGSVPFVQHVRTPSDFYTCGDFPGHNTLPSSFH